MPVSATPLQLTAMQVAFGELAESCRGVGLSDQEMAEWLLSLSSRWLLSHGVSPDNIHLWVARELRDTRSPTPLIAAARAPNDFGGRR